MTTSCRRRTRTVVGLSVVVAGLALAFAHSWLSLQLPDVSPSRTYDLVKRLRKQHVVPKYFNDWLSELPMNPDVVLHGLTLAELSALRFRSPLRALDVTWYPFLYDSRRDGYVVMAWYMDKSLSRHGVTIDEKPIGLLSWPARGTLMNTLSVNGRLSRLPEVESRVTLLAPGVTEFLEEGAIHGVSIVGKPLDVICVRSPSSAHVYGWVSYADARESRHSSVKIVSDLR